MSPAGLVTEFWERYRTRGDVDRAAVRRLAALAVGEGDEASAASRALFAEIVEPLSDAFGETEAHAYVDVFCEVLDAVRGHPGAETLERALAELGLVGAAAVARGHRLLDAHRPSPVGDARRFVVLSRVTLGADVAMATPIMVALLERDPGARVLFVAPEAARGLVAGHPRIDFRPVSYPRRGELLARLGPSLALREMVRRAIDADAGMDWLVIDPESRLTQLGLLPVMSDERTRFFPSRTFMAGEAERLGELAGHWARDLVDVAEVPRPRVWLTDEPRAWASALRRRLDRHAARWAVVNLGVGGNPRKGLGSRFEQELLRRLLRAGVGVLLTRGATEAEADTARGLAARLAEDGTDVAHLPPWPAAGVLGLEALDAPGRRQLVTWQTDTAGMAALVEAADLHVGYDSAGQHVAAAVGAPGVTVFVLAAGERHMRRWSPWGSGPTRIVAVEPVTADPDEVARRAVAAAEELLGGR